MELSEEIGKGLITLPRDILRYIWTFNHKYSCSLLKKERKIICIVIKYEDIEIEISLDCLRYGKGDREDVIEDLESLEKCLRGEKIENEESISLSDHGIYLSWKKGGYFSLQKDNLRIRLPNYLVASILRILKARMELRICDCCDKPIEINKF